jgi:HSP20 family protein
MDMIDRYEPFGRAMGLRQMMDRLMEDAFVMPRQGGSEGTPPMDVYEEGDGLIVEAHVPGLDPEDLDINVEQGVLTISGQTRVEDERTERHYLVRERRHGRFSRSLRLPATYDADACTASFEHGVLKLTFPKSEAARPRRIRIGETSRSASSGGRVDTPSPPS